MRALLALIVLTGFARAFSADAATSNEELARMHREDQADREPGQQIDWKIVSPRDAARLSRTLELYRSGALRTGEDLYRAAMILQHGGQPEHYLLAHELCVTAVFAHASEGGQWVADAKWLSAASEDRFLTAIGRKQRFGTQFQSDDVEYSLQPVDEDVSDSLREAWNVPPLEKARQREAELTREALAALGKPQTRARLLQLPVDDPASLDTLLEIVRQEGWPDANSVGFKACNAAFDILDRAASAARETIVPALQAAAAHDLLSSIRGASVEDRLLVEAGQPQLYGTAVKYESDGTVTVFPVQDPANLETRRAARGLPPIEKALANIKASASQTAPAHDP